MLPLLNIEPTQIWNVSLLLHCQPRDYSEHFMTLWTLHDTTHRWWSWLMNCVHLCKLNNEVLHEVYWCDHSIQNSSELSSLYHVAWCHIRESRDSVRQMIFRWPRLTCYMCLYMCVYVYIYIYIHMCVYVCIC